MIGLNLHQQYSAFVSELSDCVIFVSGEGFYHGFYSHVPFVFDSNYPLFVGVYAQYRFTVRLK